MPADVLFPGKYRFCLHSLPEYDIIPPWWAFPVRTHIFTLGVYSLESTKAIDYGRPFDARFYYNGRDLGARWTPSRTIFKLWSPEAERVELSLYPDGVSAAGATLPLQQGDRGVWSLALDGDLHGVYYDYTVTMGGEARATADPYAAACCRNGARSMVIDLARAAPEGFERDVPPPLQTEQVIYELHVKDFSFDPDSGVPPEYQGKFKAFSYRREDGSPPPCMAHLKSLGVTHIQLLPIFDFGSVDEGGDGGQFNWGYDPLNYNVPEGSYATDPDRGGVRVRECREMIQALHQNGFRVVMDVVYNHTHAADSWLGRSAPGYYYRREEDGSLSNGSGCGHDIAAGRAMADEYIVQSVLFWAREYHVDGFRFDLMGLMPVELMNRIRAELDAAFGPGEKLLYGEPWRAGDSPMEPGSLPALKENAALLDPGVGMFCDNTRDAVKGDCFHAELPGFVCGGEGLEEAILHAASGWADGDPDFRPRCCGQIINYVSCHDNLTLWDKLLLSQPGEPPPGDFEAYREDVARRNRLAVFICFTCLGRPFLQAGEEFGRTKFGDSNSYCSPPEVNMLRWAQAARFAPLVEYYRQLIRLRKSLPGLCGKSPEAAGRVTAQTVLAPGVVSFQVEGGGAQGQRLLVLYNASPWDYVYPLPGGGWSILADDRCAFQSVPARDGQAAVPALSGMLLQQPQE